MATEIHYRGSFASMPSWTVYIFVVALVYQIFHLIEHLAQVYQHWVVGLPASKSHGIIFFLDFEWNHFIFNTLYLIGLLIILWVCVRTRTNRVYPPGFYMLLSGTIVQGYHQIEHIVKIFQHLTVACEPCPGILGAYFDGVYLHFTLNAIVFILPFAALFYCRFHRVLSPPQSVSR